MVPNLLKASRKSSSVTDLPQTMKSRELGGSSCLLSFKAFSASNEWCCCESLEEEWISPPEDAFDFRSAILHLAPYPFTFFLTSSGNEIIVCCCERSWRSATNCATTEHPSFGGRLYPRLTKPLSTLLQPPSPETTTVISGWTWRATSRHLSHPLCQLDWPQFFFLRIKRRNSSPTFSFPVAPFSPLTCRASLHIITGSRILVRNQCASPSTAMFIYLFSVAPFAVVFVLTRRFLDGSKRNWQKARVCVKVVNRLS